jgi:hypothetical protein
MAEPREIRKRLPSAQSASPEGSINGPWLGADRPPDPRGFDRYRLAFDVYFCVYILRLSRAIEPIVRGALVEGEAVHIVELQYSDDPAAKIVATMRKWLDSGNAQPTELDPGRETAGAVF